MTEAERAALAAILAAHCACADQSGCTVHELIEAPGERRWGRDLAPTSHHLVFLRRMRGRWWHAEPAQRVIVTPPEEP